jgi:hypothetical protein
MAEPAQRNKIEIKLPFKESADLQAERERLDAQAQALWENVANDMRLMMPESLFNLFATLRWLENIQELVKLLNVIEGSENGEGELTLTATQMAASGLDLEDGARSQLDELEAAWGLCLRITLKEEEPGPNERHDPFWRLTFSASG